MKHYAYKSPFKMKDKEGVEYTLKIEVDDTPENPRNWDNMCTMVCWHRHYDLGDKHGFDDPSDFWDWIKENGGKESLFYIAPLYLYDHSGITISTSNDYPYNDRWDAGCVGFAYISKEKALKNLVDYELDENGEKIKVEHKHDNGISTWSYKTQPLTEKTWRKRAAEVINAEVETYDQYLRNDVYGYNLTKKVIELDICPHCGEVIKEYEVEEDVDSCWGFYGDCLEENGMLENLSDLTFVKED